MKIPRSAASECTKCRKPIMPRWHHEGNGYVRAKIGGEPVEWFHSETGSVSCYPEAKATPPDGLSRPMPDIPWAIHVQTTTGRIEYRGRNTLYLSARGCERVTETASRALFETGGDHYKQWRMLDKMIEDLYAGRHPKWLSSKGMLR